MESAKKEMSLSHYYNASQRRIDSWNRLKRLTSRLASATVKDSGQVTELMKHMAPVELYWAFPGKNIFQHMSALLVARDYQKLNSTVQSIVRALMSNAYRRVDIDLKIIDDESCYQDESIDSEIKFKQRPYFEVMIVDGISFKEEQNELQRLHDIRRDTDAFIYEPVFVHSFEDAINGVLTNHNIQSVVIRYDFPMRSLQGLTLDLPELTEFVCSDVLSENIGAELAQKIHALRPELDVYLVTDQSVEDIASKVGKCCRRVFYNQEDYLELHLNIIRGIQSRYRTPFFSALREYSKQPTGVFHAMPISRGKSINKSNWIKDMGDFYGMNTFLAETSATSGGLDSLLDPVGPIKEALEQAARAFGARKTFFATNGTSTCNKIVVQALVQPGDIVLVDRDCHKSHHYGLTLSGAKVIYLDSYPLSQYSMYGAVPLREIKLKLLQLREEGKLDQVKMLLLTNCTFDGVIYNVERFMQECLAIKPDLVFLWDEAWFAFASFGPTYRKRTGMYAASKLRSRYRSEAYREQYQEYLVNVASELDPLDLEAWCDTPLLPDPDKVRVRVYTTQSTHKTLTSLRQGSMIHVHDQDFSTTVEEPFHEAYMTHTSTSPNYQILASLDIGRRQCELEGFELVQKQVEMAMALRHKVDEHPLLRKYFKVLDVGDVIPSQYRSGELSYNDSSSTWRDLWQHWNDDEFVLDITRITLSVGGLGVDGDTFKTEYLMNKYGIQINKTSRNTVLFMTNIGTTRSSVAYLIEVLIQIAESMQEQLEQSSSSEIRLYESRIKSLMEDYPPLPDFSYFHKAFQADPNGGTGEGLIRKAYFLSYESEACEYLGLEDMEIDEQMDNGREVVSGGFVTPYPPGFPVLVPGQVVSKEILNFLRALDVKEIHGFRPELGVRVFKESTLQGKMKDFD